MQQPKKYPNVDISSRRIKLYTLNRGRIETSHRVGDVYVFKDANRLFVIALVALLTRSEPLEANLKNQEYLKSSTDKHFFDGIKLVTLSGRVTGLQWCIEFLSILLSSIPIFFPVGTGSTLRGEAWKKKYLPLFEQLLPPQENNIWMVRVDKRKQDFQPITHLRHWNPSLNNKKRRLSLSS